MKIRLRFSWHYYLFPSEAYPALIGFHHHETGPLQRIMCIIMDVLRCPREGQELIAPLSLSLHLLSLLSRTRMDIFTIAKRKIWVMQHIMHHRLYKSTQAYMDKQGKEAFMMFCSHVYRLDTQYRCAKQSAYITATVISFDMSIGNMGQTNPCT